MVSVGYIMTYWIVWWAMLIVYLQGNLSVDFFVISTLIMSAVAGGCLALLLYERSHRNRIIDARVAEKVDALEQRLIDTMAELESVRRLYSDRVAELDGLQRRQLDILVVEGADTSLHWDYTNIRNLGFNVTVLHSPNKGEFVAHMDAQRRKGTTPYHVHFAMHGLRGGLEFGDGVMAPLDLASEMGGVRYAFVAACESTSVAYEMKLIAGHTLCFWGGVDMDEAAEFVFQYYRAIRDGLAVAQAFYLAKERSPVRAAAKAIMA